MRALDYVAATAGGAFMLYWAVWWTQPSGREMLLAILVGVIAFTGLSLDKRFGEPEERRAAGDPESRQRRRGSN